MESLALGVGSLGTWMILFCERTWPLPRACCKAGGAREGCRDKCSAGKVVGGFAVPALHDPFLTAPKMEAYHWLFSSLPSPHSRPLWEPQKSGTWCPGNMMSVHTALVSVLNYPLK